MLTKYALTADEVEKVLAAAKAEANRNQWAVTIAIVDDGGFVLQEGELSRNLGFDLGDVRLDGGDDAGDGAHDLFGWSCVGHSGTFVPMIFCVCATTAAFILACCWLFCHADQP